MGKKPKHRVRHVPPGPCGVWFQATQAKKKQRRKEGSDRRQSLDSVAETPNVQQQLNDYYTQNANGSPDKDKDDNDTTDTPSAWQAMQNETGVTTPYNPTPWDTVTTTQDYSERRYEVVRSNLPNHYVTLWEILRGDHDMKLLPEQRLRVLVHAVEMSNHHNIWTVDLRDDTGASMKAWMEPGFIQEQLQNSSAVDDEMSLVRPGLVWMLKDCSMIIMPSSSSSTAFVTGSESRSSSNNSNISEERLERMLLISKQHIEKNWYPAAKKKNNGNGAPTMEESQQSQSSGNNDNPAAINLEGANAFNNFQGTNVFGDGKQLASPTPQTTRDENAPDQSTTAPLNEESVSDLFSQMRQQSHDRNSTERESSLTGETDRPHTEELSQFAASRTRTNGANTPQRRRQSQQSDQQKTSPSPTPLDTSALGTQEHPDLGHFRASQTKTVESAAAEPHTQESKANSNDSQGNKTNARHSHHNEPAPHTPKRKKDSTTQQSSQSSSRRRKKQKDAATSPVRTPTRVGGGTTTTQSPMTQESCLLTTPSRTPNRRKRHALSPKAVAIHNSLWSRSNVNDPVLHEMIREDEERENRRMQHEMSVAAVNRKLSQQQQPDNDSDSDSSQVVPEAGIRDYGALFDPATWEGVDMSIFDDE